MENETNIEELEVGGLNDPNLRQVLLTTKDNPYDPFSQPKLWANWDMNVMGYNTWGNIVKHALLSDNLTPLEERRRIDHAIIDLLNSKFVIGIGGYVGEYVLAVEGQTTAF